MSVFGAIWFVHPVLALAGAVCGLVPVAIHLLNRRRYRRVEWAAMRFLLSANRRSVRRLRLEQLLLLSLRVAIIVLVGLLVARPYFPSSGALPLVGTGVHRILVVDNSLSMGARLGRETRLDLARHGAHELLTTFSRRDTVSIVTLATPATTMVGQASFDRRSVAEMIEAIELTERSTDVPGGIRAIQQVLDESPSAPGNRVVYILSDFQRMVWLHNGSNAAAEGDETTSAPSVSVRTLAATELARLAGVLTNPSESLVLIQVDGRPRSNASVESLAGESAFVAPGLPIRLEAAVVNHSNHALEGARVQFRTGRRIIGEVPVGDLESNGRAVVSATAQFANPGMHSVAARLLLAFDDDLSIDDERYYTVEVRKKTRVLIVDPKPTATFSESEGAYLRAALDPGSVRKRTGPGRHGGLPIAHDDLRASFVSPVSVETCSDLELPRQPLVDFDVVALCNVAVLGSPVWDRLRRFVDHGGGLLVFLGDQVDAVSYNRVGGSAENGTLLPGVLLKKVEVDASFAPGRSGRVQTGEFLRLSSTGLTHPLLREIAGQEKSGLFDARVDGYVLVRPDAATGQVIWKYSNGDPAWILGSRGRGSLLLCTTTANMRWNTLPAKGDFVSLMLNVVSYLSRGGRVERNVMVGGHLRERLSAVEASLPLRVSATPGTSTPRAGPVVIPMEDGLATQVGPVETSGVWKIRVGEVARDFSVNIDPSESRLDAADRDALRAAVGESFRWVEASAGALTTQPDQTARLTEVSLAVLWIVVGLLVVESLLSMVFGKPLGKRREDAVLA